MVTALEVVVGSREGNGANLQLEINLGPLDPETMRHAGVPTWSVTDAAARPPAIEDLVSSYLWTFQDDDRPTKSDVIKAVMNMSKKVKRADAMATVNVMITEGRISQRKGPHREGEGFKTRDVLYLRGPVDA